jgi:outer membrane biosynthesis protein TonB
MLRSAQLRVASLSVVALLIVSAFAVADGPASLTLPALKKGDTPPLFYPAPARRLGQEGSVLVEFAISPKGARGQCSSHYGRTERSL